MGRGQPFVEHLMRRGGFGTSADDSRALDPFAPSAVVEYLINYEQQADDVDSHIGQSAYVSVTTRGGQFQPNVNIDDARQRWLFRMVHSRRPLQERMGLFWHNHFATAYSKIAGIVGGPQATKMMALKSGELPGPQGQIETFRQLALGRFRDLLIEVARDPAMVVWLDGRTNTRLRPQENFGREVMELFTFGIGNYTEQDVYAAARVFTGWNLRLVGASPQDTNAYYEFFYNAGQHETADKTFTFAVYPDGRKTIPSRSAADGMQDGIDFLTALANHPETAKRLARKFWDFFISERATPDPEFIDSVARIYLQFDTAIKPVVEYILRSGWFQDSANWFTRYSWPAEFVVRAIKEVGWNGFSVDTVRTPLTNMGQTLFEPPDVSGWNLGQEWFSTGSMLARMNFASQLAANQKFNLARDSAAARTSAADFLSYFVGRISASNFDSGPYGDLQAYLTASGAWTGSDAQLQAKAAGLTRLIAGSSEYQLV
jgi:uncharacterized protein (DUF1800 family)